MKQALSLEQGRLAKLAFTALLLGPGKVFQRCVAPLAARTAVRNSWSQTPGEAAATRMSFEVLPTKGHSSLPAGEPSPALRKGNQGKAPALLSRNTPAALFSLLAPTKPRRVSLKQSGLKSDWNQTSPWLWG